MKDELEKALDTLEMLQFYFAAVCAANGEIGKFERDCINAISVVSEELRNVI